MVCIFEEDSCIIVKNKPDFLTRITGKKEHTSFSGVLFGVSQAKKK